MEKKFYQKPESEILEIGLEGSIMLFGSDEMGFEPKEQTGESGGDGYSNPPGI